VNRVMNQIHTSRADAEEVLFNKTEVSSHIDQTEALKDALRYRNQQLTAQRGKAAPRK
jgi:hypothetical protein